MVAQSRENLCVWYNARQPEQVTMFPIKGDVVELVRGDGETSAIVLEGNQQVPSLTIPRLDSCGGCWAGWRWRTRWTRR